MPVNGDWKGQEVLKISINTKHLREKYFEGLRIDNIRYAYDYIISKGYFEIDFEDFLNGKVYDVDICYDVSSDKDTWRLLTKKIKSEILEEKKKYIFDKFANNKGDINLQLNDRKISTPHLPFIKFYHKGLELDTNSYIFNKTYLGGKSHNIGRLEYSMRTTKFVKVWDFNFVTLRDLLNESDEMMRKAVLTATTRFYLEHSLRMRNVSFNNPQRYLIKALVDDLVSQYGKGKGYFDSILFEYGKLEEVTPTTKNRLKNLINDVLNEVSEQEKLEQNSKVDKLLVDLGLDLV